MASAFSLALLLLAAPAWAALETIAVLDPTAEGVPAQEVSVVGEAMRDYVGIGGTFRFAWRFLRLDLGGEGLFGQSHLKAEWQQEASSDQLGLTHENKQWGPLGEAATLEKDLDYVGGWAIASVGALFSVWDSPGFHLSLGAHAGFSGGTLFAGRFGATALVETGPVAIDLTLNKALLGELPLGIVEPSSDSAGSFDPDASDTEIPGAWEPWSVTVGLSYRFLR